MIKYLILLFSMTFSLIGHSQIKGNKKIETRQFELNGIQSVTVGLNALVTIDCSSNAVMKITADENMFEHIQRDVKKGHLVLDQKKWIQPSKEIEITVGLLGLARLVQTTHSKTDINNIEVSEFAVEANVGTIFLDGSVDRLIIDGKVSDIDATQLAAGEAIINLTSWGSVLLGNPDEVSGKIADGATVSFLSEPTKLNVDMEGDARIYDRSKSEANEEIKTKFIQLKVKNNSRKRINAYVIGPKPDGKKFSYGFPMRVGQTRNKDWTIGSKVYRVSRLGIKKLLVEIKADDEGRIVHLYESNN